MKKFQYFAGVLGLVVIAGLVVGSCGLFASSPSSVTKAYYAALAEGNAEKLAKVMTPKGAANLTMFMEKAKAHVDELGEVTKTEETIDGDSAVVNVTFSSGGSEEISLLKIDGQWKISEWDDAF